MPFSDTRLLSVLSHTLWYLPNIASCQAMANLLHQKQNAFYNDYHVVVCAGADAGIGAIALAPKVQGGHGRSADHQEHYAHLRQADYRCDG
jgi:hypothetical protein